MKMRKKLLFALLINAVVALFGVCEIQAGMLLPFGQISKEAWSAKYYYALNTDAGPDENWYAVDFDDSAWESINGPISNTSSYLTIMLPHGQLMVPPIGLVAILP